ASAATKNSPTPTAVPASGGEAAMLRIAPTATGTVSAHVAMTNRSSRGGYVWDECVTACNGLSVVIPRVLEYRGAGIRWSGLAPLRVRAARDRKSSDGTEDESDPRRAVVPLDHVSRTSFRTERNRQVPAGERPPRPVLAVYRGSESGGCGAPPPAS